MSLGMCLLRKCMEEGLSPDQVLRYGLNRNDFGSEDEKVVFDYYQKHWSRFKCAPKLSTVKNELDVVLPSAKEPAVYYLEKMQHHKAILVYHKVIPRLIKTVKKQDNSKALTLLLDTVQQIQSIKLSDSVSTASDKQASILLEHDQRKNQVAMGDVSTGFPYFDEVTGMIQKTDFVVIAGRPGMGKSWLMIYSALRAAQSGKRVLFVTLEMSDDQIIKRTWCVLAGVSYSKLKKGKLDYWARERLEQTMNDRSELAGRFKVYKSGLDSSVEQVIAEVEMQRPDVLYVDGAYLLRSIKHFDSDSARLNYVSKSLRALALDFNIPVFASYQMNRQTGKSGGSTETIYGSDAPGQLATIGWSVSLDQGDCPKYERGVWRRAFLFKGRDGERGALIRFGFDTVQTKLFQQDILDYAEVDKQSDNQEMVNPEGTL
jgi:replicative DNA helicase